MTKDGLKNKHIRKMEKLLAVYMFILIVNNGNCGILHYCPENVNIGWMKTPPYIVAKQPEQVEGALLKTLHDGFKQCCRTNFTFQFQTRYTEISMLVDASVNSSLDIVLPIRTNVGKDMFLTSPFVPIIESPGCVFYNLKNNEGDGEAMVGMLWACLPYILMLSVWVCCFGVLFWIVDVIPTKSGQERTLRQMWGEICESIWWAFVTLATVGYGDVVPSRSAGRVLCYIWLAFSSISVSFFSANVTVILITACFNAELRVENTKIAVLNGSREHSLVVKKNGLPEVFGDMETLLDNIKINRDLEGVILDLYTASFYLSELDSYRIQQVFEDISSYGVVLRSRTIKLQHCLTQYVLNEQRRIYEDIREKFPPLKTHITMTVSEEASQNLLRPKDSTIYTGLIVIFVALFVFSLVGASFDKYRSTKKYAKSKNNSLENFVLLQDIRSKYRDQLSTTVQELQHDLNGIQNQLDMTLGNLEGLHKEHLFRAHRKTNGLNGNH